MSRTALILILCLTATAKLQGQSVTGSVNSDGMVVLTGDSVEFFGIDLISQGGFLVPVTNGDASPFSFLLTNSPNQITFANLGEPVVLNGEMVLGAGYDVDGPGIGDLTGEWGGPVLEGQITFTAGNVPEPDARAMLLIWLTGSLAVLRRRDR